MKKYIHLLLIIFFLISCQEEYIGQYPVDSTIPGKVTNVEVIEQFGGGVTIRYNIPNDDDLLYVKANYKLDDGRSMEVKSSFYTNTMDIVGFAKEEERTIELRSVDRSQNESESVIVKVTPKRSPIFDAFESLVAKSDFGGIQLKWQNAAKADLTIMVSKPVKGSSLTENVQNFYSASQNGLGYVRGFPVGEQKFIFQVRDRWGNTTDTLSGLFYPKYEEEVDRNTYWKRWNGDPSIPYKRYSGSYEIEKMWDLKTMAYTSSSNFFHGPAGVSFPIRFTFDMQQTYTLSRLKLFQRGNTWAYEHGNPKKFKIYGHPLSSARLTETNPEKQWHLLGSFESVKPSGLPLGQRTQEDIDKGANFGEDYNFDIDLAIPVRYIMFEIEETWGATEMFHISELAFWGEPSN